MDVPHAHVNNLLIVLIFKIVLYSVNMDIMLKLMHAVNVDVSLVLLLSAYSFAHMVLHLKLLVDVLPVNVILNLYVLLSDVV